MCDCRKIIEGKLIDRVRSLHSEASDIDVELGGYQFLLGDSVSMRPSLPINGTYKMPTKKGGQKVVKIKEVMIASYCPFCGTSLLEVESTPERGAHG